MTVNDAHLPMLGSFSLLMAYSPEKYYVRLLENIHGIKEMGEEARVWHGKKTKGVTMKFSVQCILVTRKYGSTFHIYFIVFVLPSSPLISHRIHVHTKLLVFIFHFGCYLFHFAFQSII